MEDIRVYIETGILELYVLGDVSPEERQQVEEMALKYPEVRAEIAEIESSLEIYAGHNAVEPNEEVRSRIMNSMLTNLGDDRMFTKPRKHAEEEKYDDDAPLDNHADNVVVMQPRQGGFFKYAFAACLVLLLVSIYGLVNLYGKLQDTNSQLTAMQADREKIANQVNVMDTELDMYRDPSFKVYKLQGTPKNPQSNLTLAWSPAKRKVMLDMKSMKLPAQDKQHQFQLWALVGGKPVDLGVFNANGTDSTSVKEMKEIALADAFAVTMEPMGGSVNPTLDQMVAMAATK